MTRPQVLFACLLLSGCPDTETDTETSSGTTSGTDSGPATMTAGTTTATGSTTSATESTETDDGSTGETDPATGSTSGGSGSTTTGGPADCAPPVELGVYTPADGDARGFERVGDTVYLATRTAGLDVVDITDPAAAVSLGAIDLDGQAMRVAVDGTTAYVGLRGSGWAAVDVADPGALSVVSSDDTVDAQDVAVADGTLFVVDNTGLLTYDVSDPANPMPLSSDLVLAGSTETVELVGDVAYVAANGGALSVVDIADPSMLMLLTEVDGTANGDHVWVGGDSAYVATADGVGLVDIATPSRATEVGFYMRDRATVTAAFGSTVFVFGTSTASTEVPFLQVISVADPASPTELHTAFDDLADPEWTDIVDGMLLFSTDDDDALHLAEACPSP